MKIRELRAMSLDRKWTSLPAAAEFGPPVDLTRRSPRVESRLLLRARSTGIFKCCRSTTTFNFPYQDGYHESQWHRAPPRW
jgi:hypothetical protein